MICNVLIDITDQYEGLVCQATLEAWQVFFTIVLERCFSAFWAILTSDRLDDVIQSKEG